MLVLNWQLLWTVFNLLVLYLLLKRFLFRPITRMMEARRAEIASCLSDAQAQKQAGQALAAQMEARLAQCECEAGQLLRDAQARSAQECDALLRRARAEAAQLLADARCQIEHERMEAMQQARQETAALVLLAAARLTQKSMDRETDWQLASCCLEQAGVRHE